VEAPERSPVPSQNRLAARTSAMMMQMDGGMMGGMMSMGWIWTLVGILVVALLSILIYKQLKK
jgi:hypothetical protein